MLLSGEAINSVTRKIIEAVNVELMASDSTVIATMQTNPNHFYNSTSCAWGFVIPKTPANYIVRFTHPDYETKCISVEVKSTKKRQIVYPCGVVKLRKATRNTVELGEVTVKASLVKIYSKGDTIVYNADAFQLAEGSMLDALIRQLPGVELKDDGQILVNGRYVESLLLNGDDFFKGDNEVMLDNLPAYMVQNVQVYEKQSRLSEFVGRQVDENTYVMDVKLKRQYAIGWMGNAEVAGGTEDRYMARLFGLRFTPQSRLSFFGNINNVNESRKPGQNGDWTPSNVLTGQTALKTGGIDYSVKDKYKRYEVKGSAQVTHSDLDSWSRRASEEFLPEGNTFGSRLSKSRSCNTKFVTGHDFYFRFNDVATLEIKPEMTYGKWDNRNFTAAATFSENPYDYVSCGLLDTIMQVHPGANSILRKIAINRTLSESLTRGNELFAKADVYNNYHIKNTGDVVLFDAAYEYKERREDVYNHYRLDYPSNPQKDTDYRNRWTHNAPDRTQNATANAGYIYILDPFKNMYIQPYYRYSFNRQEAGRSLYRLDWLDGWGEGSDRPLGLLPSAVELHQALDRPNSYDRTQDRHTHLVGMKFQLDQFWLDGSGRRFRIYANLPLRHESLNLDYRRGDLFRNVTDHKALFYPSLNMLYMWHGQQRSVSFDYNMGMWGPTLLYLVDVYDNSNPLSLTLGNPDLKGMRTHGLTFNYKNNSSRKQRFFNLNMRYNISVDATAWGFVYNRETGVRTSRPENVTGNYDLGASVNYTMPLDKEKRLTFTTATSGSLYNSVDLIGIEGALASTRSTVQSTYVSETLKLDYRIKKWRAGVKGGGTWTHATSKRADFMTIDAFDFNYGLTGQVDLPWDIQLSTDLTMYSRRGYDDDAMNTNDLIWNARVSKRIPKYKLTIMLDGFDMLHNLSNVTRVLNGQGRTETYRNGIPSYVMLHCIYRMNIKPKKLPGA